MSAKPRLVRFIVMLGLIAGCSGSTYSSGDSTVGGRKVTYSVEGGGGISPKAGGATVTFPGGSVVVEKSRALLDGKEVAKVPEDAKVVAVDYSGGKLTITADGAKVYEEKAGK